MERDEGMTKRREGIIERPEGTMKRGEGALDLKNIDPNLAGILLSFVVRLSPVNLTPPIDLFQQNHPKQLMGKSKLRKTQL